MKPNGPEAIQIESISEAYALSEMMKFVRERTERDSPVRPTLLVLGAVVTQHLEQHSAKDNIPGKPYSLEFAGDLADIVLNVISLCLKDHENPEDRVDPLLRLKAEEMMNSYVEASMASFPDNLPPDTEPPPEPS